MCRQWREANLSLHSGFYLLMVPSLSSSSSPGPAAWAAGLGWSLWLPSPGRSWAWTPWNVADVILHLASSAVAAWAPPEGNHCTVWVTKCTCAHHLDSSHCIVSKQIFTWGMEGMHHLGPGTMETIKYNIGGTNCTVKWGACNNILT